MDKEKIINQIMDVAGRKSEHQQIRVVMDLGDGIERCYEDGELIPCPPPSDNEITIIKHYVTLDI